MARIQTYNNDVDIDDADRLVGTDGTIGADLNKTKNFTLGDIKNYVRSGGANYKVYTALLNQSGGDDGITITSGELVIGVTYKIKDSGGDWVNVGAPNNDVETYFVATGTTPNNWGVGSLLYNTGAPVATVLENTIGNIWFTYSTEGLYFIESDGLFYPANKSCVAHSGTTSDDGGYSSFFVYSNLSDTNDIKILVTNVAGFSSNSALNAYLIEIRVYN